MTDAQRLPKLVCRVAGVVATLCAACLIATTSATFSASVTPNPKLSGANPHVALGTPNPHVDGANWGLASTDPHWDSAGTTQKMRHDSVSPDLKTRH
jgi:hypothetical protein